MAIAEVRDFATPDGVLEGAMERLEIVSIGGETAPRGTRTATEGVSS